MPRWCAGRWAADAPSGLPPMPSLGRGVARSGWMVSSAPDRRRCCRAALITVGGLMIVHIRKTLEWCVKTNGTHNIYSNILFLYFVSDGSAHYYKPMSFPFSCVYPLQRRTNLNVVLRPFLRLKGAVEEGSPIQTSMSLYRDPDYRDPYPAGSVRLPLGTALYMGVSVEAHSEDTVVVLEECSIGEVSSPSQSYPLLRNRFKIL
ncbi:alpha-tectorin-like [Clupea harengus]|uniref:Alpha-tectorin-like n=1 Tax=Clupea harengus TaxID=7950 RepID=A0A8M1KAY7_CLUHA|nr:alpha-tectorin-like [Clupea harengus]